MDIAVPPNLPPNPLALAFQEWLGQHLKELAKQGCSASTDDENFLPEMHLYSRIAGFPFHAYPDFCVPWHLLKWPHMRWEHVYHLAEIIESLRQPTGAHVGGPMVLQAFQLMMLVAFLGPEYPDSKLRVVREGLLTLARKQSKSTTVAAIVTALMCLHPDDHGLRGQEIQVGAADRDQAGIIHGMCERFVQLDEVLDISNRFRSVPSKKTLTHNFTLTQLRCLSSDAYRQLGGNPVMVLLDEIGNVPGQAAEEFYSALTTGFGAQDEPLTLLLSTQAPNDQHFFSQQVDRCMALNEGRTEDPEVAGFVFTVPETGADGADIDPFDPRYWYLGAPGWGTIYNPKDMQDWAKRARDLPSLQNRYENLKLNRRVSETSAFVSRTAWQRNGVSFDLEDLRGRECTLGLDLSETTDLTALVAVFEPMEIQVGNQIEMRSPVLPFFWIPGDGLVERSKSDKVPYDVWSRDGYIDTQSHRTVDYRVVARKFLELMDLYEVIAVGFDRWKMKYMLKALEDEGFEFFSDEERDEFLISIGQGFKDQSRSVELLETRIIEEKLAHGDHPILTWNVGNTVTISDPAGNRKFEKTKSFGRIDGCVALALAIHARGEFEIESEGESMYNDPATEAIM